MRASFYLVRHGSTAANNPRAEKLRGWKPWPLSPKGEKEARSAGYYLTGRGVTRIWHSPLRRVKQTVEEINRILKLEPKCLEEHGSLVDWNTGAMEGMLVEGMKPFLDFYQRNPELVVPQGECYQEFWDRWKAMFRDCCDFATKNPDDKLVCVTHARNLVTVQHWMAKRPIGPVSYDEVLDPGGVVLVSIRDGKISIREVHGGGNKKMTALEKILSVVVVLGVLFGVVGYGYQRELNLRAQLASEADKKVQAAMAAKDAEAKADRDASLQQIKDLQAKLDSQLKAAQSPQQIAGLVSQLMALKQPITFVTPPATPSNPNPQPIAQVPVIDAPQVKDYVQACEQCKLDLSAAKTQLTYQDQQLADRTVQLKEQKDETAKWKSAANGGSWLKRAAKAAEYIGIGVAIGAAATCGSGHCK